MWRNEQIIIAVCALSANLVCSVQGRTPKVSISIYFESLCPDSHNFIVNQLYPSWDDIRDYVDVRFVPFGKSTSLENGTKFACQHGSNECKGNRIISCALSRLPDQDLQVQYLRCFMDVYKYATIDEEEKGQKCAQILGLVFEEFMRNCYQTKEGTRLQLAAEEDTRRVGPKFVPTVVYNGVFDQQLQNESIENFRETVCKVIQRNTPETCTYRTVIHA
ncbi:GILT-like protein 1 [Euwallacea similis]|uniref:GILT-like protein 1 n=1 Tax=Euwallacea similis TaxID=1736056 RepID=UPI00344B3F82